jgi:hypothetical protein
MHADVFFGNLSLSVLQYLEQLNMFLTEAEDMDLNEKLAIVLLNGVLPKLQQLTVSRSENESKLVEAGIKGAMPNLEVFDDGYKRYKVSSFGQMWHFDGDKNVTWENIRNYWDDNVIEWED